VASCEYCGLQYLMILGPLNTMAKGREAVNFYHQIERNQELGLSTFHTRGQSPNVVPFQNAYMAVLFALSFDLSFDQNHRLSKEVWIG